MKLCFYCFLCPYVIFCLLDSGITGFLDFDQQNTVSCVPDLFLLSGEKI
jgi:hypothetical protein